MEKYLVRLLNYKGSIIDGYVFVAQNSEQAVEMYKARCNRLGIEKCVYDTYSVEKWPFD